MAATIFTTPKSNDRITQLWDDLLANPVPPDPASVRQKQMPARFERNDVVPTATWMEPAAFVATDNPEPAPRSWKVDLAKLFHSLLEFEGAEAVPVSEAFLDVSGEPVTSSSIAAPFRWEPKPAWISAPGTSTSPLLNPADPRLFVARPRIPIRPLHKQPFYMRFIFCLRRWLSRKPKSAV